MQGLPRFGVNLDRPPPQVPDDLALDVVGDLTRRVSLTTADLARLPRCEVEADLHCVAGWSGIGLRWEGVAVPDLYELLIKPALVESAQVAYAVFVGLDGYRSIVAIEDVLTENVLLADRLDGQPLTAEHGAPLRLVSPHQYGFISTKNLCRIELYDSEPPGFYHPTKSVQRALRAVRPHRRARVWHEERHRYLPSWLVRRLYRLLIKLPAPPR